MGYLIKYSEAVEPSKCSNCESVNIQYSDITLESGEVHCKDCGEVSPITKDTFYLNHAYLSSCAFGSLDMAWSTDDKEKADLMLYKVEQHHPDNPNIIIEEY